MTYQVSFRKRFNLEGEAIEQPASSLSLPQGVLKEARIVEPAEPLFLHCQGDDEFLSLGIEVWAFDVAPGKEGEFIHALKTSNTALNYAEIDEADEAA